ncbi:lipid A export permease/ATP-binding protein MsbA [Chitinimonas sp.]|uniref:lipid A export permease/ATP-binding protein MsbA n=1 Tax=Chitinimonas sp. TaxID=1934313 RepID=UPI0035ADD2FC
MPNSRELYLRILRHTLAYRWVLVFSIVALVVIAATEASYSHLLGMLIDADYLQKLATRPFLGSLLQGFNLSLPVWGVSVALLGVAFVRFLATYINAYTASWVATKVQNDLRALMFNRLMRLPVASFDQTAAGVLMSRLAYDVSAITQAGTQVLTVLFKEGFTIVFLLVNMLVLDWQLTLFCLVIVPAIGIVVSLIGRRMRRISLMAQGAMGEMTRILDEAIGAQRIVKVFGGRVYEEARFDNAAKQVRHAFVKIDSTSALSSGLMLLLVASVVSVIVFYAKQRVASAALTNADFIVLMTSLVQLQSPIKNISKMSEQLQRGLAAAETVFGLIDTPLERDEGKLVVSRAQGALAFEQVSFHYGDPARLALNQIDLRIAPGEVVALVGSSGGGKTTLATLLPRFYDPSSGRVTLDGHDLRDYTLANLRQQIALVSQDVVLFNDTVAANIAYGAGEVDQARVEAAARAAFAHDFIVAMPQGYASQIGENGTRLSGGQRQRLAIARAIYKDAPILILDEATSALDTESERQVQAALDVLMRGRTTVIIAHRLSTIENADRIIAMQGGRVVEVGSHDELLARDGVYAGLYRQQRAEAA